MFIQSFLILFYPSCFLLKNLNYLCVEDNIRIVLKNNYNFFLLKELYLFVYINDIPDKISPLDIIHTLSDFLLDIIV